MLLSFIIPTYNRGEIFNRTFLSLVEASQGLQVEIIVVNDYKKAELILPVKKDNIRVVNNPKQGPASARNYGASLAQGEYLVFLDDDILVNRKNIETIVSLHQGKKMESYMLNWSYPEDLIDKIKNTKFGVFLIENSLTTMRGWRGDVYWSDDETFEVNSAASYCLVLHNEVFRTVGGYNDKFILAGFEDYDFPMRLMEYGVKFFIYPLDMVYHNEADRVTLKSFLMRKQSASITRRIGVDLGYQDLAIRYSSLKKLILEGLLRVSFFLYILACLLPNLKIARSLYGKLVGILTAVYIYRGYTKKWE